MRFHFLCRIFCVCVCFLPGRFYDEDNVSLVGGTTTSPKDLNQFSLRAIQGETPAHFHTCSRQNWRWRELSRVCACMCRRMAEAKAAVTERPRRWMEMLHFCTRPQFGSERTTLGLKFSKGLRSQKYTQMPLRTQADDKAEELRRCVSLEEHTDFGV